MSQPSGRNDEAGDAEPSAPAAKDTVLIHGVSSDGESLAVLRTREDRIESGVVRKLKEGEPILGELVRLKPRPESPLVCDVEVDMPSPVPAKLAGQRLSHGGPAQVATPRYRDNWDAIWSKGKKSAPN